jgi:hypothetical protein
LKTVTSRLLLKLTNYLSGHISRMDIVAWARDELLNRSPGCETHDPERTDRSPNTMLIIEVLGALSLLPQERSPEYAPARAGLSIYKHRLENTGTFHP